jgi:hypothetical protein
MGLPEDFSAMRDALSAAMQSHQRLGKAAPCDCSLCAQIKSAMQPEAGRDYRKRLREECAKVADWIGDQVQDRGAEHSDEASRLAIKTAREIAARIRLLDSI